ncbi:hypothetical protein [Streptomyces sp. NPDC050164]|uniref:hypothetical protein n=1 Tax=Streptomyces sp. NPDC050164 TaxID=3365605 RepID=UPI0037A24926
MAKLTEVFESRLDAVAAPCQRPDFRLHAAWKLLPQGAAADLLSAYGVTMEATVPSAQGWAGPSALDLISIGQVERVFAFT